MSVQIELTSFFVGLSNNNKKGFEFVIDSIVPKDVLLKTYKMFVRDKLIIPIENLDEQEKIKLVENCRETGIKFTNKTLSDAARILHTLNLINENT